MKIERETKVILSSKDLKGIITNHLKNSGIQVKRIEFNVGGHELDGDYRLDNVVCYGTEEQYE